MRLETGSARGTVAVSTAPWPMTGYDDQQNSTLQKMAPNVWQNKPSTVRVRAQRRIILPAFIRLGTALGLPQQLSTTSKEIPSKANAICFATIAVLLTGIQIQLWTATLLRVARNTTR